MTPIPAINPEVDHLSAMDGYVLDTLPEVGDGYEIFIPLSKAVSDKSGDGKIWISGIASDESPDLDSEIVMASQLPQAIDYLSKFGKLNWDHHNSIIGDVTEAKTVTPEYAKSTYGITVTGRPVELRGWVMPLSASPNDPDLKEVHKMLKAGCKLGFSMQGNYAEQRAVTLSDGRTVIIAVPGFVNQVAITPHPKNTNAVAFKKSLAGMVTRESNVSHQDTRRVICCMPGSYYKGIETTGIIAGEGTVGGDALKLQELSSASSAMDSGTDTCQCKECKRRRAQIKDKGASEVQHALHERKAARRLRKSVINLLDMSGAIAQN